MTQSSTTPEPKRRIGTLAALQIRDYRWLLTGTVLSNASIWIQQVTMGWLVYDLTGSGTMLGTVAQYPAEMGRIAVESALKIINGESVPEYVPVKIEMFTKANL